jgi:hypothetical protein
MEERAPCRSRELLGGKKEKKMNWRDDHPIFFEGDGKTTNPVLVGFKNYSTVDYFMVATPIKSSLQNLTLSWFNTKNKVM